MKFEGNFILGYNALGRQTLGAPPAGHFSNGTIFTATLTDGFFESAEALIAYTQDALNTAGILLTQPEGVDIVEGDSIDLTCGTIRIDVQAYEAARLEEIATKGSSTMCDLSNVLSSTENKSITGMGCILELVQVVR